jgi:hypothetical protein
MGEGIVKPRLTTCRVRAATCVVLSGSEPAACVEVVVTHRLPVVREKAVPVEAGVRLDGFGVQGLGGAVDPSVQLNDTELLYPSDAVTVPLKVGVVPEKAVRVAFGTRIWKSGTIIKLNCHTPRP